METPTPVNLAALKGILANAKKVMHKAEEIAPTKKPSKQTQGLTETYERNTPMYDENDEKEIDYTNYSLNNGATKTPDTTPKFYTTEQVMASKLPDNIKQAMIKNPIPMLQGPPSKFTLEDLQDLAEKPKQNKPTNIVTESRVNRNSDLITISKSELKEMIDERVIQILTQSYNKTITEDVIKKTINTLIKEGKVTVKKKS